MLTLKTKNEIRKFVKKYGKQALKSQYSLKIFEKDDGVDVATHMDRKIEKEFFKLASKLTPDFGFLGEEFDDLRKQAEFVWTIDPIDGTKYYAKQIPLWTISISLLKAGQPIFGLIYYPSMDQLFEAEEGKGAYLNSKKVKISTKKKPKNQLQMAWDCSPLNKFDEVTRAEVLKDFAVYQREFYRVRNFGSATLGVCWMLTGFLGAFVNYETNLKEALDDYAGIIIAKEAGLKVTLENKKQYTILKISLREF